jgi:hypothetical protein
VRRSGGRDQGPAAGASSRQGTGQGIEPILVHDGELQGRLRMAVKARRQDGAQSPSSVGVLLGRSIHLNSPGRVARCQSTGAGIPSCTRAQLEERRNTSSVRLRRTTGSSGLCCSSCCSRWSACSSMDRSRFSHSASMTARQVSQGRVIVRNVSDPDHSPGRCSRAIPSPSASRPCGS